MWGKLTAPELTRAMLTIYECPTGSQPVSTPGADTKPFPLRGVTTNANGYDLAVDKFLRIYLNDQLALGLLWRELAQRITEDVATFRRLKGALGMPANPVKLALVVAAERVGRLKLNGRLRGYSPLSSFTEVEFLVMGIEARSTFSRPRLLLRQRLHDLGRDLGNPDVAGLGLLDEHLERTLRTDPVQHHQHSLGLLDRRARLHRLLQTLDLGTPLLRPPCIPHRTLHRGDEHLHQHLVDLTEPVIVEAVEIQRSHVVVVGDQRRRQVTRHPHPCDVLRESGPPQRGILDPHPHHLPRARRFQTRPLVRPVLIDIDIEGPLIRTRNRLRSLVTGGKDRHAGHIGSRNRGHDLSAHRLQHHRQLHRRTQQRPETLQRSGDYVGTGGGAGFTDTVTLPPQDTNDAILPLSFVGVETIPGDDLLGDRSDAALPRERPRPQPHHRLFHRNPVVRSEYPGRDMDVPAPEHPDAATTGQCGCRTEFGDHRVGDRVRVRAALHVIGRRQRDRRASVEFEYPERCASAVEGVRVHARRPHRQCLRGEKWPPEQGLTAGHVIVTLRTVKTIGIQTRALPQRELQLVELLRDPVTREYQIPRRVGHEHRNPDPVDPCPMDQLTRELSRHRERFRGTRFPERQVFRHQGDFPERETARRATEAAAPNGADFLPNLHGPGLFQPPRPT
ncbi:hypothetical protein ST47_g870 [Ascochyta rabiei]|uniref:Uncharacterized protein n=1 Tax=Didymella rabiei TaxID=5454 RepID=A0A163LQ26_DIDRA|nr:hypothetical protein ST47_g870 [Ascochyta rabiei]